MLIWYLIALDVMLCVVLAAVWVDRRRLERAFSRRAEVKTVEAPVEKTAGAPPKPPRTWVWDPGKQALEILRRGDNCDWYSIKRTGEMHEAFDCLEIYWRTRVDVEPRSGGAYGRFEDRAGFRVRWHVSATHTSYVEAYGLDLMATILEARELADRHVEREHHVAERGHKHPALEAWKAAGEGREYNFHGLRLDKWSVRLEYPGGMAWSDHADLDEAVRLALAKTPEGGE